jgi:predicted nucleic acid-binding protein
MSTELEMDIVVDTSVIVAVIAHEPQRGTLIELTRGADLLAPASVHWEIGNAFSAMLKRNRIELEQALQAIAAYRQIPVRYVDVELDDALELAAHYAIYAYDAYLIRCGLKFNAPLLSLDSGLLQAAEQAGVHVIEVT